MTVEWRSDFHVGATENLTSLISVVITSRLRGKLRFQLLRLRSTVMRRSTKQSSLNVMVKQSSRMVGSNS